MRRYTFTSQKAMRAAFRAEFPSLNFRRYGGEFHVDTRMAWVDWVDCLCKAGMISDDLAFRATL